MKRDSRLSGVLHLLLHMAQRSEPMTSELLAHSMQTHPVVIRRILAGLRTAGFVQSTKGHGGGWSLARELSQITLRDVYEALGSPSLLAMANRTESPGCLVEAAVNTHLSQAFHSAEQLLLTQFAKVTLAMLNNEVGPQVAAHRPAANGAPTRSTQLASSPRKRSRNQRTATNNPAPNASDSPRRSTTKHSNRKKK